MEVDEPIDPKQLANEVIMRAKLAKMYEVRVEVEPGWMPNGMVPFDLKITNGICIAKVIASSKEEAEQKVSEYFNE